MQIAFNPIQNIKQTRSAKVGNFLPRTFDNLSFCAKGNIGQALIFAEELTQQVKHGTLSHQRTEQIVKKTIPTACVDDISNLPEEIKSQVAVNAYLLPHYNSGMELDNVTLYLAAPNPNDKSGTIKFIANATHEYTHALQRNADKSYMGLNKYTNSLEEARVLNYMGNEIFNSIQIPLKNQLLSSIANPQDIKDINKYGTIFPRPFQFSESMVLSAFKADNFSDFKNGINGMFNQEFEQIYEAMNQIPEYRAVTSYLENPTKLKQILKELCIKQARMEQEAYKTGSMAAKGYLKINKQSTTNAIPVLFDMIIRGLSD